MVKKKSKVETHHTAHTADCERPSEIPRKTNLHKHKLITGVEWQKTKLTQEDMVFILSVGMSCPQPYEITGQDVQTVLMCLDTDATGAYKEIVLIRHYQFSEIFYNLPKYNLKLAREWKRAKDIVFEELPESLQERILKIGFSEEQFVRAYLETPDSHGRTSEMKALDLTPKWERWALDNGLHPQSLRSFESRGKGGREEYKVDDYGYKTLTAGARKLRQILYRERTLLINKAPCRNMAEKYATWIPKFLVRKDVKKLLEESFNLKVGNKKYNSVKAKDLSAKEWQNIYNQECEVQTRLRKKKRGKSIF